MLETNEKNRVSQPRSKKYEEEPNGNFRAEKYDDCPPPPTQTNTSVDGLNSRMEGIEERISELEDRTLELPNLNKLQKID